ncbi:hypothetical protein FQR65_LT20475 [Abscondita terminalis]|nr:hypothetical protein FQR65_LT20475 [Abscondita terminalis]
MEAPFGCKAQNREAKQHLHNQQVVKAEGDSRKFLGAVIERRLTALKSVANSRETGPECGTSSALCKEGTLNLACPNARPAPSRSGVGLRHSGHGVGSRFEVAREIHGSRHHSARGSG